MQSTNEIILNIPGKVFLLGEYLALWGERSMVAAVSPRFFQSHSLELRSEFPFHEKSPAGRLLKNIQKEFSLSVYRFQDPHHSEGGFGASTAQFAMLLGAYSYFSKKSFTAKEAWLFYRDLHREEAVIPSGADLVAQILGGVQIVEGKTNKIVSVLSREEAVPLMVFSATHKIGRKTNTHEHLDALSTKDQSKLPEEFFELNRINQEGSEAWFRSDWKAFGESLSRYSEELCTLGLVQEDSWGEQKFIKKLRGVLGVKGCGAMGSDSIVVCVDPSMGRDEKEVLIQEIRKETDLRLVCSSIQFEPGLQHREVKERAESLHVSRPS